MKDDLKFVLKDVALREYDDIRKVLENPNTTAVNERTKEIILSEQPIVEEFCRQGYVILTLDDLKRYRELMNADYIQLIIDLWPTIKSNNVRTTLFFVLSVNQNSIKYLDKLLPISFGEWDNLSAEDATQINFDALGNFFVKYINDEWFEDIKKRISDTKNREKIGWLLLTLGNMIKNHDAAFNLLIKYGINGADKDWCLVIEALGKLKDPRALPYLYNYLKDDRKFIHSYAKKAIAKIEKAQQIKKGV